MLLGFVGLAAQAAAAPPDKGVIVHGQADGDVPGWAIGTEAPAGWTSDCCTYAKAIGVNLVIYQGEWSGEPNRVMVLNVWPRKRATLDAELLDDRTHYLQSDPAARVTTFAVRHPSMACMANAYEGSDRVDDVVVFCDPGAAAGVRLSWSMTLVAGDASRRAMLDRLMTTVVASRYRAARGN
jgi:hypothetical protein